MSSPRSPRSPRVERKSRKPGNSDFEQQRMRAWQPVAVPTNVIGSFLALSAVFLPIGIAIVVASNSVIETDPVHYEHCETGNTNCSVSFRIESKMDAPVYMYYQLSNFHQNHRRYVSSRSDDQLRGTIVSDRAILDYCEPLIKPNNLSNAVINYYNPCGLVANSWFSDEIQLTSSEVGSIPLRSKGISWKSDRDAKFKKPDPYKGQLPVEYKKINPGKEVFEDFENEDFIVWMRTAGLPKFKKLYRIIDQSLEPGDYTLTINNRFEVNSFDGEKAIILSTMSWIGGKNDFLGWAYIFIGILFFSIAFLFGILTQVAKRSVGDENYLKWTS
eukprot:TRINITY_DN5221_c0_g2_i1.p1 TRINITY_DN5221_c0_g2~~TRINITY_DN5221_c0_g2_i1.p1  ORF type:complete len:330 (-),score=64.38 TRINITY_DN5221_c0_g2_i1:345-1334(-)